MLQTVKKHYHFFQSLIANLYYGFPSRKLKVIGVTGTDGKTTTTHLIYHILTSSGKKASLVSSVYAKIAGKTYQTGFHVTTPDVFPVTRFLRESVNAGDEFFVLETTSHSLAQNRTSLIRYEAAVVTNITHEHLDFHKTYEDYVKSKAILLQKAKKAILNIDDQSFSLLCRILRQQKFSTYGLRNKADFHIDLSRKLNLDLSNFNNYNFLSAYSLCKIIGIADAAIFKALKTFKLPPGRLEMVVDKPFKVIIDFAHTPNAFHQVLSEIKERYLKPNNRLIHVFGAAAQRDKSKRPQMGKESGEFVDIAILTEEDFRDENPSEIAEQIASGLKEKGFKFIDSNYSNNWSKKTYTYILDRKKAIEKAISIAQPGDVVITTGKSHEKSLCRGKKEYPWDEKKAVLEAINNYP